MMKRKQFPLFLTFTLLCVILCSGCMRLPWDFRSAEEAQKYALSILKDKYHEDFMFVEDPTYKEETIGIHWISGKFAPKDDPDKISYVYARNTAMFEDNYHVYYYADQIRALAVPLFEDQDYIKEVKLQVTGRRSSTQWTGEESLEEYLAKNEYQVDADVYLYEDLTDEEYTEQVSLLISAISDCDLIVQMDIWDKPDEWIFRAFSDDGALAADKEGILSGIHSHRSLRETQEDYKAWKKEQQQTETDCKESE